MVSRGFSNIFESFRKFSIVALLLPCLMQAQEVLLPLHRSPAQAPKSEAEARLPFFDDFADYSGAPAPARWATPHAFVNQDYATLPPTVGMVTLDCLDAQGNLYPQATSSRFGADTLCSLPLRLDSLFSPTRKRLTPADSVRLSFFFLPGGGTGPLWERVGEAPDEADSLILEFYDPEEDSWQMVWATPGICVDSLMARTGKAWQYVNLPVSDPRYFHRGFRFRFRNFASLDPNPKAGLVANTDQWNLDYILLDYNRRATDRTFRDVAFVEKAPSMLARYQAMPWRQFSSDDMADRVPVTITNLYSQTLTTSYKYNVYSAAGTLVNQYNGGNENAPSFPVAGTYQTAAAHAQPPVDFTYPVYGPTHFTVEHIVTEGLSGDSRRGNDTIRLTQTFSDYFAYDDGVPENGYGISSTGSKLWMACRFDLRQEDTLTAVDLYFNQTRNGENLGVRFYLCVWACHNGRPSTLLLRDEVRHEVRFSTLNQYQRYRLGTPIALSDTVFVGLEQQGSAYINLGFDRTHDARECTWYRVSNQWQQSILRGALMLRPCFGQSALVGIDTPEPETDITVYPNPSHGDVQILSRDGACPVSVQAYDTQGRRVACETGQAPSLHLAPGCYLLKITTSKGSLVTKKLIVL